MVSIIDLKFQGFSKAIACFVVNTNDGPVLIETGPHSTYKNLERSVNELGFTMDEIRHVLISHIHFDHAGAAWALAKAGAKIYLHPLGAKHMADPSKLYESAKRIYKDKMDTLWGKLEPIKKDHLFQIPDNEVLKIGGKSFVAHHTPGHAVHHIAWQLEDILFTGDVAGVKVQDGPIVAPCPPPDIDIEDWKASLDRIRRMKVSRLFLTHFGEFTNVNEHLDALETSLLDWANWIKVKWEQKLSHEEITPLFQQYVKENLMEIGLTNSEIDRYEAANPAWMSVAGLMRYWSKKAQNS